MFFHNGSSSKVSSQNSCYSSRTCLQNSIMNIQLEIIFTKIWTKNRRRRNTFFEASLIYRSSTIYVLRSKFRGKNSPSKKKKTIKVFKNLLHQKNNFPSTPSISKNFSSNKIPSWCAMTGAKRTLERVRSGYRGRGRQ